MKLDMSSLRTTAPCLRDRKSLAGRLLPGLCTLVTIVLGVSTPAYGGSERVLEAKSAYDSGEYEIAEKLYKKELQAFGPVRDTAYATLLSRLGECYYMNGRLLDATSVYKSVVALDEQLHGMDSLEVADDLFNLTRTLRRQLLWSDAEPVILRTLEIRQSVLGDKHSLTAMSWMDLAVNYQREGRLPESESAFLKTISIKENLDDGMQAAAVAYLLYARLLQKMDRVDEAEKFIRRAKEINSSLSL
jgi:tetratricopeptide (TPR) repeat protein